MTYLCKMYFPIIDVTFIEKKQVQVWNLLNFNWLIFLYLLLFLSIAQYQKSLIVFTNNTFKKDLKKIILIFYVNKLQKLSILVYPKNKIKKKILVN